MTDGPDLSVIVVTYNGRELALATLRSARAAVGAISCEWLVVDSGSTDGTPDAIETAFPDVRVFRSTNRGFAAGNNVALGRARGRYVLLLNPDTEIAEGTLADLVAALDARPKVGVASVLQRGTDGRLLASVRRFPTPLRTVGEALGAARLPVLARLQELDTDFASYARERPADWLVGAFLIARRTAVEQVGPLDDGFFLYAEETDWCRRFRQAGWDVRHLPLMTITHHDSGDRRRPGAVAQLVHSRRRFAYKHFGRPRAIGFHAALALNHLLRLAVVGPPAALRPALRRRAHAEASALAVLCGAAPPHGSHRPMPRANTRSLTMTHDARPILAEERS
jgi:GT2 family glycosyltransferase